MESDEQPSHQHVHLHHSHQHNGPGQGGAEETENSGPQDLQNLDALNGHMHEEENVALHTHHSHAHHSHHHIPLSHPHGHPHAIQHPHSIPPQHTHHHHHEPNMHQSGDDEQDEKQTEEQMYQWPQPPEPPRPLVWPAYHIPGTEAHYQEYQFPPHQPGLPPTLIAMPPHHLAHLPPMPHMMQMMPPMGVGVHMAAAIPFTIPVPPPTFESTMETMHRAQIQGPAVSQGSSSAQSTAQANGKKKSAKRQRNPEKWKRNNYQKKSLKEKGPCKCPRRCFLKLSDATRARIRETFNNMDKKQQNVYLLSLIRLDARKAGFSDASDAKSNSNTAQGSLSPGSSMSDEDEDSGATDNPPRRAPSQSQSQQRTHQQQQAQQQQQQQQNQSQPQSSSSNPSLSSHPSAQPNQQPQPSDHSRTLLHPAHPHSRSHSGSGMSQPQSAMPSLSSEPSDPSDPTSRGDIDTVNLAVVSEQLDSSDPMQSHADSAYSGVLSRTEDNSGDAGSVQVIAASVELTDGVPVAVAGAVAFDGNPYGTSADSNQVAVHEATTADSYLPQGNTQMMASDGGAGGVSSSVSVNVASVVASSIDGGGVSMSHIHDGAHQHNHALGHPHTHNHPHPHPHDHGHSHSHQLHPDGQPINPHAQSVDPSMALLEPGFDPVGGNARSVRRRTSKRYSAQYFVNVDGKREQICHFAFLSIHGIGKKRVDNLLTYFFQHGCAPSKDGRGKYQNRSNRIPDDIVELAKEHIRGFGPFPKAGSNGMMEHKEDELGRFLANDLNVIKMYRMFLEKHQPILLDVEKLLPPIAIDRPARGKKARKLQQSVTSGGIGADGVSHPLLVATFDRLLCSLCHERRNDQGGLIPVFYCPPSLDKSKARNASPFQFLLGLFCSEQCMDQFVRAGRIPCATDGHVNMATPIRSYKEIPEFVSTKELLKPLISRDKYDRLFREVHTTTSRKPDDSSGDPAMQQ